MDDRIEIEIPDVVPIVAAAVVVWCLCAVAAAICAPRGRSIQFAVVTLLFLGPLGVGFAAVAARPHEPKAQHGRCTVRCPRCDARQHVMSEDKSYECWRCHDRYEIEKGPFGSRFEVARESTGNQLLLPGMEPRDNRELAETSWRKRGEWADPTGW